MPTNTVQRHRFWMFSYIWMFSDLPFFFQFCNSLDTQNCFPGGLAYFLIQKRSRRWHVACLWSSYEYLCTKNRPSTCLQLLEGRTYFWHMEPFLYAACDYFSCLLMIFKYFLVLYAQILSQLIWYCQVTVVWTTVITKSKHSFKTHIYTYKKENIRYIYTIYVIN